MRITAPGTIQAPSSRRTERRGSTGGFSALVDVDAPATAGTTQIGAVASVGAILALQQVEDATSGQARAVQRAGDLLDELEEIRRGLILGDLSQVRLQQIARRLAQKGTAAQDPVLQQILQDIELRVAVELAKMGNFGGLNGPKAA